MINTRPGEITERKVRLVRTETKMAIVYFLPPREEVSVRAHVPLLANEEKNGSR